MLHQELLRRPKHKGNFDARVAGDCEPCRSDLDLLVGRRLVDGNRDFSIAAPECARATPR